MSRAVKNLEEALAEAHDEIRRLREELRKHKKHNARGAGRKSRMTEDDKLRILEMRREGVSYSRIAAALNLPVGSVYNYSKLNLNMEPAEEKQSLYNRFTARNIMNILRTKI